MTMKGWICKTHKVVAHNKGDSVLTLICAFDLDRPCYLAEHTVSTEV